MIKEENFTIGSTNFVKHYSDSGFKIKQVETGILYDEANDVVPCKYTYEESDEVIENEQSDNFNKS